MTATTPSTITAASLASHSGGVQAGYGVSLTDLSGFEQALTRAQAVGGTSVLEPQAVAAPNGNMQALFKPLEHIDGEATSLHQAADAAQAAGNDLTPSEMVTLSMQCQEFMFDSELTANVANQTSDGLQQLFKQQA